MKDLITLKDLPKEGLKLTLSNVGLLDTATAGRIPDLNKEWLLGMVNEFDGTRIELYLKPFSNGLDTFLQLRCGGICCDDCISIQGGDKSLRQLIPFMAAIAGKAGPEPTELDKLKERILRLEEKVGIQAAEAV